MHLRTVGHRIVARRRVVRLSQAKLAEKIDVSVETMGRIERGKSSLTVERLIEIARILGCDAADLLRAHERTDRRDRAVERVNALLRRARIEEVELVADLLAVALGRR